MLKGIKIHISPHADCFNRCQYIKKAWILLSQIILVGTQIQIFHLWQPGKNLVYSIFSTAHISAENKQKKQDGLWHSAPTNQCELYTYCTCYDTSSLFSSSFFPISSQCTSVSASLMGNSHPKPYLWDLWQRLNAHITNINSDDPCLTKHFKFIKKQMLQLFQGTGLPRHV